MAWVVEHSAETDLPAALIWAAWADVSGWSEWNPDVASAELQGDFAAGGTITMTLAGGDTVSLEVFDVVPEECFVDEAEIAGTLIRTVHEVRGCGEGRVRIVYRLEATGPDADQFGAAISADFPETIAGLLEYAGRAGSAGHGGGCATAGRDVLA